MAYTRAYYSPEFKLEVTEYAEKYGCYAARIKFSIDTLKKINTNKKCYRGWPQLDAELKKWVDSQLENKQEVNAVKIQKMAKRIAKEMSISDFGGKFKWVYKFMERHNIYRPKRKSRTSENNLESYAQE
ncbi:hypothetical protein BLOT_009764 [Blomia tropicalis]|nr:hypothetical protein BLOT_009764 [Blomia tropicalis]